MAIDAAEAKAFTFPSLEVTIERGRLRFFASATGSSDRVYTDVEEAQRAGHRDLPVPPTFFFSLELESPNPFAYVDALDIDLRTVLHGEQSFTYHHPVYAGDTVRLDSRIDDVFAKKGGALEFLVKRTDISRADQLVAETTSVIVVRNAAGAPQ